MLPPLVVSLSTCLLKNTVRALCCWGLMVNLAWAAAPAAPLSTTTQPSVKQGSGAHQAATARTAVTAKQVASAQPDVHINRASADELAEALIGVGPAKAKAIVAWRQTHGAFKSLDDLQQIKGIGPSILSKNKAHIRFD